MAYEALQGRHHYSRLWDAIAQWRDLGQASNPEEWPLAAEPDADANDAWRDRSVGREVLMV
jgi:hypothetical protein